MRLPLRSACVLSGAILLATPAAAQSRGELLYTTHCIACHTTQVHWRDRRLATDWTSLQQEVVRWQAIGALSWSEEDVSAVTRYLNQKYYGFKPPGNPPVALTPAKDGGGGAR